MSSSNTQARNVDTADHNGLRGIAAIWVMLFHIFVYSNHLIDIQGSTLMPLFFSLSGFSMAVGYTGKLWKQHPSASEGVTTAADQEHISASASLLSNPNSSSSTNNATTGPSLSRFFYNRLIRIMPVYYLCLLLALPMTFAGYGTMQLSYKLTSSTLSTLIVNIFPVSTWPSFALGGPIDGPEWTISTLVFFWFCFPYLLRYYEKKSDTELLVSIMRLYWCNIVFGAVFFIIGVFIGGFGFAFWLSTGWPISRLPVFMVGVNAGILCHRYSIGRPLPANTDENANAAENGRAGSWTGSQQSTMPWFPVTWSLIPYRYTSLCCCSATPRIDGKVDFAKTIAWRSIQLLLSTCLLAFLQAGNIYIVGNVWLQFLNVFAQLDILVAFCQYGGQLMVSSDDAAKAEGAHWTVTAARYAVRIFRHPWCQWFGELSMSLYMVHWPVIFYGCWLHHGSLLHWPNTLDCDNEYDNDDALRSQCNDEVDAFNQARTLPYWMIPIVAVVAILLAALLYYLVEVPVRKYFK